MEESNEVETKKNVKSIKKVLIQYWKLKTCNEFHKVNFSVNLLLKI